MGGITMLVVQLLRGALKHAGNRSSCRVVQLISAVRGFGSSSQESSVAGRTYASSCADGDQPRVLITG